MLRATTAIREMPLIGVLAAPPFEAGYTPTVDGVASGEIREFLTTRRARVTPERAGLRAYGGRRRVSGLRREEVALLANISVEYYTQLERGNVRGVSEDVLEAVARALQLDEVERSHLFDLVRAAKRRPTRPGRPPEGVRPSVQRVLDTMTEAAAFVRNGRLDILSMNRLGYALYSEVFVDPELQANLARFISWTASPARSTRTGRASPMRRLATSALKRAAIPMTGTLPISSASFPCEARTSAFAGPPTTFASTAPALSRSTTRSLETSPSATRPCS